LARVESLASLVSLKILVFPTIRVVQFVGSWLVRLFAGNPRRYASSGAGDC